MACEAYKQYLFPGLLCIHDARSAQQVRRPFRSLAPAPEGPVKQDGSIFRQSGAAVLSSSNTMSMGWAFTMRGA